ncbi:MAG: bacillithiol biosynthesis cysteine-adding enzyme BshC [Thermoflavifilum sp.]|nr:bacillithiol biosynthesis cysteine-adding enzyme BshC [Thermoflavifilum sp.]
MDCQIQHVAYANTGYFSSIIIDYLKEHEQLKPFYSYSITQPNFTEIIAHRRQYPFYRELLVEELLKQYAKLELSEKLRENIFSLQQENTFTVCTAHQPNLFTGYLYVIYKIVHIIKLAETLNERYPHYHIVPVYFMGSEDNDLNELSSVYIARHHLRWNTDQQGAVGRMKPDKELENLIQQISQLLPATIHTQELISLFRDAYLQHSNIQDATLYLINALFGEYGLVVFIPDRRAFKQAMIPIFEEELLHQTTQHLVQQTIQQLSVYYPVQAHPREINLFYLNDQIRERIVKNDSQWKVLHSDISWDEHSLKSWINQYPEQISPNVMLRGLMQEKLLPNLAFVGGGGELAYWLELKSLFDHFNVHYPLLLLRTSWLWIPQKIYRIMERLHIECADVFQHPDVLIKRYVMQEAGSSISLQVQRKQIEQLYEQIALQARSVDPTLVASVHAARVRSLHMLENLELKMLRAQKKKMHIQTAQIERIHQQLFPENQLQERIENLADYYAIYGKDFIATLHQYVDPLLMAFTVATYV